MNQNEELATAILPTKLNLKDYYSSFKQWFNWIDVKALLPALDFYWMMTTAYHKFNQDKTEWLS